MGFVMCGGGSEEDGSGLLVASEGDASMDWTMAARTRPISCSSILQAFGTSALMDDKTSASRTSSSKRRVEMGAMLMI